MDESSRWTEIPTDAGRTTYMAFALAVVAAIKELRTAVEELEAKSETRP